MAIKPYVFLNYLTDNYLLSKILPCIKRSVYIVCLSEFSVNTRFYRLKRNFFRNLHLPMSFSNIFSCILRNKDLFIKLKVHQEARNVSVWLCLDLKILWAGIKFYAEFHNFPLYRFRHWWCHFAEYLHVLPIALYMYFTNLWNIML